MDKKLLKEIHRIHVLTYGEKGLNEQNIVDLFFGGKKTDDPKKADTVSTDVDQLYENIQQAINLGGLTQQKKGNMNYQKSVESMQIGLILLGYELPRFGVDGLFGPETASAVSKFKLDEMNEKNPNSDANPEMLKKLLELLKSKNIKSEDLKKYTDTVVTDDRNLSLGGDFTNLNLLDENDVKKYAQICQSFINTQKYNLLNITGDMLASAAVNAFKVYKTYVPPELALAQLAVEGGFVGYKSARPIKTNNPFNFGNVDSGKNVFYGTVQDGINAYYNLIARSYLGPGRTPNTLLRNFVNRSGNRYATDPSYEYKVKKFVQQANNIAKNIT